MGKHMAAYFNLLPEYPLVKGVNSFDMSNVIENFVRKAHQ